MSGQQWAKVVAFFAERRKAIATLVVTLALGLLAKYGFSIDQLNLVEIAIGTIFNTAVVHQVPNADSRPIPADTPVPVGGDAPPAV